jgi:pyruvate formate lyase activating enzyme
MHLEGKVVTLVHGQPCSVHVDPIEKKPIFHLLPGSGSFSLAAAGCNLSCKFCQNWGISQAAPEKVPHLDLPPEKVVEQALAAGCRSVAYTYTEPSVFYEYMVETADLARARGLHNVWVTAGYLNPEPLRQMARVVDCANIDLKSFSDRFYREVCGGTLAPVLEAIELACSLGMWVELTNLVVPTLNDDPALIRDMCRWIRATLGPDVPLHFSRFFPQYRLTNLPPTPLETLSTAREIALEEGIRYVYTGNVPHDGNADTRCHGCGEVLVGRRGYMVTLQRLRGGSCPACGTAIPGIWS